MPTLSELKLDYITLTVPGALAMLAVSTTDETVNALFGLPVAPGSTRGPFAPATLAPAAITPARRLLAHAFARRKAAATTWSPLPGQRWPNKPVSEKDINTILEGLEAITAHSLSPTQTPSGFILFGLPGISFHLHIRKKPSGQTGKLIDVAANDTTGGADRTRYAATNVRAQMAGKAKPLAGPMTTFATNFNNGIAANPDTNGRLLAVGLRTAPAAGGAIGVPAGYIAPTQQVLLSETSEFIQALQKYNISIA